MRMMRRGGDGLQAKVVIYTSRMSRSGIRDN